MSYFFTDPRYFHFKIQPLVFKAVFVVGNTRGEAEEIEKFIKK